MHEHPFQVWARRATEERASLRCSLAFFADAVNEAQWIARASGHDGAVSVWVEERGRVIWAAGEKATEIDAAATPPDKDQGKKR